MDKLKQSKTSVEIELENNETHYVGGEFLTGQVLLTVNDQKGIILKELTGTLVCDVDIKIGEKQAVDTTKNEVSDKIVTRKMRLFNQEHRLEFDRSKLKMGQHSFPFRIPLPAQHPTLPPSVADVVDKQTYGNINYYLKVKAKRGLSSWFSKSEMSAKCPFEFMPVSFIGGKSDHKMQEVEFSSLVDMNKAGLVGAVKKMFTPSSARDKDPKMALYCTLKVPTEGIRQDIPNCFKLVVRPGDNTENIMIKWVTLSVESILTMKTEKLNCEHVISKLQLLQKMSLSKGNVIDLSEYLRELSVKQKMIPTFSTPMLSHLHRLRIELTVMHSKSHETSQVVEVVPIIVLSPHVLDKSEGSSHEIDKKESDTSKSKYLDESHSVPYSTSEKHTLKNSDTPHIQREGSVGKASDPYLSQHSKSHIATAPPTPPRKPALPSRPNVAPAPGSNVAQVSPTAGEDAKEAPPPTYEEST